MTNGQTLLFVGMTLLGIWFAGSEIAERQAIARQEKACAALVVSYGQEYSSDYNQKTGKSEWVYFKDSEQSYGAMTFAHCIAQGRKP